MHACVYDCLCFSIYMYGFISLKIMIFFFNLLNENFQQCTKAKRSKVYTSASTYFPFNLLNYSHCYICNVYLTYW